MGDRWERLFVWIWRVNGVVLLALGAVGLVGALLLVVRPEDHLTQVAGSDLRTGGLRLGDFDEVPGMRVLLADLTEPYESITSGGGGRGLAYNLLFFDVATKRAHWLFDANDQKLTHYAFVRDGAPRDEKALALLLEIQPAQGPRRPLDRVAPRRGARNARGVHGCPARAPLRGRELTPDLLRVGRRGARDRRRSAGSPCAVGRAALRRELTASPAGGSGVTLFTVRSVGFLGLILASLPAGAWEYAGEPPPADPTAWVGGAPSSSWSTEVSVCANHGYGGEWFVAAEDGTVVVRPFVRPAMKVLPFPVEPGRPEAKEISRYPDDFIEVPDGILAAFNHGEFGGGVWWFARDGAQRYRVFEDNPLGFHRQGDEVLVVSGLAHLGLRRGEVRHLRRQPETGRWEVVRSLTLGGAAEQFVAHPDGGLLVLLDDGLLRYREGSPERLVRSEYGSLYPNSMVLGPSGSLFVGMRYAVVEFRKDGAGYREQWWVPPSCAELNRPTGEGSCQCAR